MWAIGIITAVAVVVVMAVRAFRQRYITTKQAMRITGYSRSHILRLVRTGRLRGKKTPAGWLIRLSDVKRRAAARREIRRGNVSTVLMAIITIALICYVGITAGWGTVIAIVVVGVVAVLVLVEILKRR